MIDVYGFLWLRCKDYGVKYQSGAVAVTDFNTRLDEVQKEIYNDLSGFYAENEKVRALFQQTWVRRTSVSATNGTYTITPANQEVFDRVLSMAYADNTGAIQFNIDQVAEDELVVINRYPSRRPSIANKVVYYFVDKTNTIILVPSVTMQIFFFYLVFPTQASIAFTYTSTANEDIMTYDPTNSVQLAWEPNAANIILYKMLEKYGVGTRNQWLAEYARLGITGDELKKIA